MLRPALFTTLLAINAATAGFAAPDAGLAPTMVLDLPADGFFAGRLVSRPAGDQPLAAIPWQSPLFAAPVEFPAHAILRVRFARPANPPPPRPGGWRCDLDGGDAVVGDVAGLDAEHLTFAPADAGSAPVRIRREAVARLTRLNEGTTVVVPGGLEAWRTTPAAWTAPGGRPTAKAKAAAYRSIEAARRACYDLALSWTKRPDFEIAVAADERLLQAAGKPAGGSDAYRVECVGAALVAIREGAKTAFEPIGDLPADARSLRLVVFVDRDRGRMAVVLPGAEGASADAVFDVTQPPRGASAGGFFIRLRGGDVRIDALRVTAWREPEARVDATAAMRAEAYDAATKTFTVRDAGGERPLPAAAATVVAVRGDGGAPPPTPPDAVRAVFTGGSRLTGRIRSISDAAVVLTLPAFADDFACRFDELAMLEAAAPAEPSVPPGRPGMLEAAHGRSAGCLATAADGEGVAWHARGATAAVRFAAGVEPLRIDSIAATGTAAAKPAAGGAFPATVYLRNGDSFSCEVLGGDAVALRVKTAVAAEVTVPAAALRAVELVPADSQGIPREKLARLLTLPRMQAADPPTHMLRLQAGDYVRGRLVGIDATRVRFDVLGTVKEFARPLVARLIWLSTEGEPPPAGAEPAAAGLAIQGRGPNERRMTVAARRVAGDQLVGEHHVLGAASIDLATTERLLVGAAIGDVAPASLPYGQWVLKPAAVPRALASTGKPTAAADPRPQPPARAAPDATAEDAVLAAAERAALAGDRVCLEQFGSLLSARSSDVRRLAIARLRRMIGRAGRDLAFRPDEEWEKRQADALRWRQWIAREGAFATVAFPSPQDAAPPRGPLGRTLCSLPGAGAVVELDDRGRETFRVQAKQAYACELLADGHRLVADGKSLVEYDAAGREVWSLPKLPRVPMSVRRLDDGNTLVAFDGFDNGRVVEYDPAGVEVWTWNAGDSQMPSDAVRLPDGATLVALHGANRVIEVDASGSETWGIDVNDPLRVERLDDGRTLVVSGDDKRAQIYDRDGGVGEDLGAAQDARAAVAGILVLDLEGGVVEQRPEGKPLQLRNLPAGAARFQRR